MSSSTRAARQLIGSGRDAASVIVDTADVVQPFDGPTFNNLVIYELHVGTFHAGRDGKFNFAGVAEKLDYIKDLGVNAIQLMPVHENGEFNSHDPDDFDWGYDPVQLFAVERSYGSPRELKELVRACHARGIDVILDVVYNHLHRDNLLTQFGGVSGPTFSDGIYFYGDDRKDSGFGPRPDYGRPQVRDYINGNAEMWLREYGMDGLRWDSTVNIRTFAKGGQRPSIEEGLQLMREFNGSRAGDPVLRKTIGIAEDLQSFTDVVNPAPGDLDDLGFNSQWDDELSAALRNAVVAVNDNNRDVGAIKRGLEKQFRGDAFTRIIYSENHDKVGHPEHGERRLPALIDVNNPESVFAKKRSTLAAAVVLTAPGMPMLFQGQEMLDPRDFDFFKATPVDWERVNKFKGIVQMYRDLIALRRNERGKTAGLTLQHLNVFHADVQGDKVLAYHRFGNGGAGDDVVVVVNLANRRQDGVNIGFPRAGTWKVRFNSGAKVYDPDFVDGDSFDVDARQGDKDGLRFNGNVGIGPYSVVILSQN